MTQEDIAEIVYEENAIKHLLNTHIIENRVELSFSVLDEEVKFYLRVEGDVTSKNVIIFYNGAIDLERKKDKGFVFQRSTWAKDFDALVINVDDATTRLSSDIVLGWGQGSLEKYYSAYYNKYVQDILEVMTSESLNRLHVGSSAGGYQAIVGAAYDQGSRAIVFNPQIDWSHHFFPGHMDRLRNIAFKGYSFEALRSMYPWRLNCVDMAIRLHNIPSVDYYVNAAFMHDVDNQLMQFMFAIRRAGAEMLLGKEINTHMYYDASAGHNPPTKDVTVEFVKRRLL